MEKLKELTCGLIGVIGGTIVRMLGGWSADLQTLITFMVIDFAMGLAVAFIFKKSNKTATGAGESNACFKGLCKKAVMLLIVLIAYRLDITLQVNYIRTTVIIALIVNELISIVENAGLMGVKFPKAITNAIDILQKKSDGSEDK
ncbi:toxin secretion/phage lysis holin [Anaerosporobacter mobilis DSM 15930]|jgi:toxin secretion/phage lysis holin|uniref:Toxin secretion/phage lysis holin n=1 Tax=Anaerosporobacter mobilis DSM 15930 TaxID=1120996 RepID=A0A1M7NP39_9FIRM|nr:phage holin family protein [Anaerosporobacter mobilis]SHN05513.1 toxin secretion/phage lysis holin [Anaerosporobacter mobilis DSM 15930]